MAIGRVSITRSPGQFPTQQAAQMQNWRAGLTALSDYMTAVQQAQKQRYESELWQSMLKDLDKPGKKKELAEVIKAVEGGDFRTAATLLQEPPKEIPDVMRARREQPGPTILQRFTEPFRPGAPFRGGTSPLEQMLITSQAQRDPRGRMSQTVQLLSSIQKMLPEKDVVKKDRPVKLSPREMVRMRAEEKLRQEIISMFLGAQERDFTPKEIKEGNIKVLLPAYNKIRREQGLPELELVSEVEDIQKKWMGVDFLAKDIKETRWRLQEKEFKLPRTQAPERERAITELQKAGAPVTEANIKAAIEQLR